MGRREVVTGDLAGLASAGRMLDVRAKLTSLDEVIAVRQSGLLGSIYVRPGESVVVGPGMVSMSRAGAGGERARYTMEPVEGDDGQA